MSRIDSNDVVLEKTNDGVYDIVIDEEGDIKTDDFLDTSLLRSIFGERRALPNEMPDPKMRRGWVGNVTRSYEDGSKVWLFEQSPITRSTLNGIDAEIKNGLQWLIDDNIALSFEVNSVIDSDSSISANIKIQRSYSQTENRFFKLFDRSGVTK